MKVPFFRTILTEKEKEMIKDDYSKILDSGVLSGGKFLNELEEYLETVTRKKAVVFSSCTTALYSSLLALNKYCSEVFSSCINWFAASNAIVSSGSMCRYVPVDENGLMEKCYKGFSIPTTLYGQKFSNVMEKYFSEGVTILDAAHSLNQLFEWDKDDIYIASCFSLHATKICTSGEGGFVITNDESLAETLRIIRWQGVDRKNRKRIIHSLKFDIPETSCSIALRTLQNIHERIDDLYKSYKVYLEYFNNIEIPVIGKDNATEYGLTMFNIKIPSILREEFIDYCKDENVIVGVRYPILLECNEFPESFKDSKKFSDELVTLPFYPFMKKEEIEQTINTFNDFYNFNSEEFDLWKKENKNF